MLRPFAAALLFTAASVISSCGGSALEDDPELAAESEAVCAPRNPPSGARAAVLAAFDADQAFLEALVPLPPAAFTTTGLYNLQLYTAPMLKYATSFGDVALVERLSALYDRAFARLRVETKYMFYYLCRQGSCPRQTDVTIPATRMWTDPPLSGSTARYESVLNSAQFAFAVARVIEFTAELPAAQRPPALVSFVRRWLPVILNEHYLRWTLGSPGVFQRTGWGCGQGSFNATDELKNLLARRYGTSALPAAQPYGHCNAVWDLDLWLVAGVGELLMANKADPALVPMGTALHAGLTNFFRLGDALMANRTVRTSLRDGAGVAVEGRLFDPGAMSTHQDYAYAGDLGSTFPGWLVKGGAPVRPPHRVPGVGWDNSHARRLVTVLDTMRRATIPLSVSYPSRADLVGFARQISWKVARRDGQGRTVGFNNFMDGSNGWYRVNYHGMGLGDGTPPGGLAPFVVGSGYGAWGAYEASTLTILRDYDTTHPLTAARIHDRVMNVPGLIASSSEPRVCP